MARDHRVQIACSVITILVAAVGIADAVWKHAYAAIPGCLLAGFVFAGLLRLQISDLRRRKHKHKQ
jgi:hypothetical protein